MNEQILDLRGKTPDHIALVELRIYSHRKKNYFHHCVYAVDKKLSTDTHLVYEEWMKRDRSLFPVENMEKLMIHQDMDALGTYICFRMMKPAHPEEKDADQVLGAFEAAYTQIVTNGGMPPEEAFQSAQLEFLTIVKLPVEHHYDEGPEKRLIIPSLN